jgi:hypothetical protein
MPLSPYLLAQISDFRELVKFLSHSLATNDVMVHWLRPNPRPTWNGSHIHFQQPYKVFENIHMLWMGIWVHPYTAVIPVQEWVDI